MKEHSRELEYLLPKNEDGNKAPCIEAAKNYTRIRKNVKNVVFRAVCLCPVSPDSRLSVPRVFSEKPRRTHVICESLSRGPYVFLEAFCFFLFLCLFCKGLISSCVKQNHSPHGGKSHRKLPLHPSNTGPSGCVGCLMVPRGLPGYS